MVTFSPYSKHDGPGPHESGSPQSVHAPRGGTGKTKIESITEGKLAEFNGPKYQRYRFPGDDTVYQIDVMGDSDSSFGQVTFKPWIHNAPIYGALSWWKGNEILRVDVVPKFRRRGVATEMLRMARQVKPDLKHSRVLLDDGKAWADVVKNLTTYSPFAKHPGPDGSETHSTGTGQEVHAPSHVSTRIGGAGGSSHPLIQPGKSVGEALSDFANGTDSWTDPLGYRYHPGDDGGSITITDETGQKYMDIFLVGQKTWQFTPAGEPHKFTVAGTKDSSLEIAHHLGIGTSQAQGADLIPLAPLDAEALNVSTDLPDPVRGQYDDVFLTHEEFMATDAAMFGGKAATQYHNPKLEARTFEGKRRIAEYMRLQDQPGDHISGDISRAFADAKERLDPDPAKFMDMIWEEHVGPSEGGYDPTTGEATWIRGMGPQQIEGQMGVIDPDNPLIPPGAKAVQYPEAMYFEHDDVLTLDPTQPAHVKHFLEGGGFHGTMAQAGFAFDQGELENHWDVFHDETVNYIGQNSASEDIALLPQFFDEVTDANGQLDMDKAAHYFREKWASSSSHPMSIAIQQSLNEQFDLHGDMDHWKWDAAQDGTFIYKEFKPLIDAYASSVYANTQAGFAQAGITHVPVIRGMGLNKEDLGEGWTDLLYEAEAAKLRDPHGLVHSLQAQLEGHAPSSYGWEERLEVMGNRYEGADVFVVGDIEISQTGPSAWEEGKEFRMKMVDGNGDEGEIYLDASNRWNVVMPGETEPVKIDGSKIRNRPSWEGTPTGRWIEGMMDLQPLSSFSTHPDVALGFSSSFDQRHDYAVLVKALVPVERIWGHALDNLGSLGEHEVMVLGGTMPMEFMVGGSEEIGKPLPDAVTAWQNDEIETAPEGGGFTWIEEAS